MGVSFKGGYCSISFSIYNLVGDVSIFVVSYSVPSIIILPFSNKLSSIRKSVCSLTMIFPILEQSYIIFSIIVSLSSLTSWSSTNPFPNILFIWFPNQLIQENPKYNTNWFVLQGSGMVVGVSNIGMKEGTSLIRT